MWLGDYWLFKKCTVLFVSCLSWAASSAQAELTQDAPPTPIQQMLGPMFAQQCKDLPMLRSMALKDALHRLYQTNGYLPLWNDAERLSHLRHEFLELAHDGLNPLEYLDGLSGDQDEILCSELRHSSQYLRALEHLSRGRLVQQQQEPMWTAPNQIGRASCRERV